VPVLPTWQQLYDAGKAEILGRNPRLTNFTEGSRLDAITGAAATLADELVLVVAKHFAAQFFDSAEGADLDALAADRFGLTRFEATKAQGYLTWTKGDPALSYVIPAGLTFSGEVEGVRFTVISTEEASLAVADLTVLVPCEAAVAGPEGNLDISAITTIDASFPTDLLATVNNDTRFAGGADAENDATFRDRIKRYFQTLRRGTVESIKAGARAVPGVRYVTVDESEVPTSGIVYMYIGDPDARSNDLLAAAVEDELVNWRPAGVLVEVLGADRQEESVTLLVSVRAGADRDAIATNIRAAVSGYAAGLEPSEKLRLSRLLQLAHNAHASVVSVEATSPTADVTPTERQDAIRVVPEAVSITFVEVLV
jgi:uncharacterized phage protein gp47/JayE